MTARYFSHSPRGFANEITIYAVEAEKSGEWEAWFNNALRTYEPGGQVLVPITRKAAERLLRRDGVSLQTHEDDAEFLSVERLLDKISSESVASACRAALAIRADWEQERAFERDMDSLYPEFAAAAR